MKRAKGKRQGISERQAMARLVREGRFDLIEAVQRGEMSPTQVLNKDLEERYKARDEERRRQGDRDA